MGGRGVCLCASPSSLFGLITALLDFSWMGQILVRFYLCTCHLATDISSHTIIFLRQHKYFDAIVSLLEKGLHVGEVWSDFLSHGQRAKQGAPVMLQKWESPLVSLLT